MNLCYLEYMNKWGKLLIATMSTMALTACGGTATSETDTTSAVPATPDEIFAEESGLTGAELTQGIEWSQNMCAVIAKVILSEGDGPGIINKGMLMWFDSEGLDIWDFDETTIVPLTIAGAKTYCPEYENGVEVFFTE